VIPRAPGRTWIDSEAVCVCRSVRLFHFGFSGRGLGGRLDGFKREPAARSRAGTRAATGRSTVGPRASGRAGAGRADVAVGPGGRGTAMSCRRVPKRHDPRLLRTVHRLSRRRSRPQPEPGTHQAHGGNASPDSNPAARRSPPGPRPCADPERLPSTDLVTRHDVPCRRPTASTSPCTGSATASCPPDWSTSSSPPTPPSASPATTPSSPPPCGDADPTSA